MATSQTLLLIAKALTNPKSGILAHAHTKVDPEILAADKHPLNAVVVRLIGNPASGKVKWKKLVKERRGKTFWSYFCNRAGKIAYSRLCYNLLGLALSPWLAGKITVLYAIPYRLVLGGILLTYVLPLFAYFLHTQWLLGRPNNRWSMRDGIGFITLESVFSQRLAHLREQLVSAETMISSRTTADRQITTPEMTLIAQVDELLKRIDCYLRSEGNVKQHPQWSLPLFYRISPEYSVDPEVQAQLQVVADTLLRLVDRTKALEETARNTPYQPPSNDSGPYRQPVGSQTQSPTQPFVCWSKAVSELLQTFRELNRTTVVRCDCSAHYELDRA